VCSTCSHTRSGVAPGCSRGWPGLPRDWLRGPDPWRDISIRISSSSSSAHRTRGLSPTPKIAVGALPTRPRRIPPAVQGVFSPRPPTRRPRAGPRIPLRARPALSRRPGWRAAGADSAGAPPRRCHPHTSPTRMADGGCPLRRRLPTASPMACRASRAPARAAAALRLICGLQARPRARWGDSWAAAWLGRPPQCPAPASAPRVSGTRPLPYDAPHAPVACAPVCAAHNQLLAAIKGGEAQLKHVETVDKSKPTIDPATHLNTVGPPARRPWSHSCHRRHRAGRSGAA
jgi:hypothetical protein